MTGYRPNLFYALWPDDATRAALAQLQSRVQGRLTRTPNLHLTLAFLGPQPDALLPMLRSILTHLNTAPLELHIDRLGHFGKNRIAWAGMQAVPPELAQLQRALVRELAHKGITHDSAQTFRPHITLARHAAAPSQQPFDPLHWHADRVVLARSPLPDEKPFYQVLASKQAPAPGQQALPID